MKIVHAAGFDISKDVDVRDRNACIFLLNNNGAYLSIPCDPSDNMTNFNGLFVVKYEEFRNDYSLFKSLDNIYLCKNDVSGERLLFSECVINNFSHFTRVSAFSDQGYGDAKYRVHEDFTLLKNGVVYDAGFEEGNVADIFIKIDTDFRGIFDYNDAGRIYKISRENFSGSHKKRIGDDYDTADEVVCIEYTKFEDNTLKKVAGKHYLMIHGIREYINPNTWSRRNYYYDASRISKSEFYVYNALKIPLGKSLRLVMSYSDVKEKAYQNVLDILKDYTDVKDIQKQYEKDILSKKVRIHELSNKNIAMAYASSMNAMHGLLMDVNVKNKKFKGLWAGLPWFFQFWSRDELISTGGLIHESWHDVVKEILFRHLNEIMHDGRIPNIAPTNGLGSADGVGWLFKRIRDMIQFTEEMHTFNDFFTLHDIKYIREKLSYSINHLMKHHSREGLIYNERLETWMDTSYNMGAETDTREGFRIEIQALFLSMLGLMNKLDSMLANKLVKKSDKLVSVNENDAHVKMEENFLSLVRQKFLHREIMTVDGKPTDRTILYDGYNSSYSEVCRPNIFLAYYIYPDMLSSNEWEEAFDYAIERLWCEWDIDGPAGGFSTIDKRHSLYQPKYTGQDNRSYHRGDSWFYINNIAAICMHRLNKGKYARYITAIMRSSSEDILYSGFIGYASELTSSSEFRSGGCFCQLWSISTFIELVNVVFKE